MENEDEKNNQNPDEVAEFDTVVRGTRAPKNSVSEVEETNTNTVKEIVSLNDHEVSKEIQNGSPNSIFKEEDRKPEEDTKIEELENNSLEDIGRRLSIDLLNARISWTTDTNTPQRKKKTVRFDLKEETDLEVLSENLKDTLAPHVETIDLTTSVVTPKLDNHPEKQHDTEKKKKSLTQSSTQPSTARTKSENQRLQTPTSIISENLSTEKNKNRRSRSGSNKTLKENGPKLGSQQHAVEIKRPVNHTKLPKIQEKKEEPPKKTKSAKVKEGTDVKLIATPKKDIKPVSKPHKKSPKKKEKKEEETEEELPVEVKIEIIDPRSQWKLPPPGSRLAERKIQPNSFISIKNGVLQAREQQRQIDARKRKETRARRIRLKNRTCHVQAVQKRRKAHEAQLWRRHMQTQRKLQRRVKQIEKQERQHRMDLSQHKFKSAQEKLHRERQKVLERRRRRMEEVSLYQWLMTS